jgi:hypothetical protein
MKRDKLSAFWVVTLIKVNCQLEQFSVANPTPRTLTRISLYIYAIHVYGYGLRTFQ